MKSIPAFIKPITSIDFEELISEEDIKESIKRWRRIYYLEKDKESKKYNRKQRNSKNAMYKLNDRTYPFTIKRPFFYNLDHSDHVYIRTYRMVIYGIMQYSRSMKTIVMKASGYNLGRMLVKKKAIRSLDDLPKIFILQRIGILDVVDESLNTMRINIYECMSCYGMKNLEETMCDFEAGVIEGVMEELYGKNTTIEKYCWGLGNHFCGFEVYFE